MCVAQLLGGDDGPLRYASKSTTLLLGDNGGLQRCDSSTTRHTRAVLGLGAAPRDDRPRTACGGALRGRHGSRHPSSQLPTVDDTLLTSTAILVPPSFKSTRPHCPSTPPDRCRCSSFLHSHPLIIPLESIGQIGFPLIGGTVRINSHRWCSNTYFFKWIYLLVVALQMCS